MPKPGRLYIAVDLTFWDGDGADLSERAQNLFLRMCARSKWLGTAGFLSHSQIGKMTAPVDCGVVVDELLRYEKPDGGHLLEAVPGGVQVLAFADWYGCPDIVAERSSSSGSRGNHQRWHVARGMSDPECSFCCSSPDNRGDIGEESPPESQIRPDQIRSDQIGDPDRLRGFDKFWGVFPPRHGRKVGRGTCEERWAKLSLDEKRAMFRAAQAYRTHCDATGTLARDPLRWMRGDDWREWLAGAVDGRAGVPLASSVPPPFPSIFDEFEEA